MASEVQNLCRKPRTIVSWLCAIKSKSITRPRLAVSLKFMPIHIWTHRARHGGSQQRLNYCLSPRGGVRGWQLLCTMLSTKTAPLFQFGEEIMKQIALALLFVFATGPAVAQTYACQFIMSAGMNKTPQTNWRVTSFILEEPFFITMSNDLIDTKSLTQPPLDMASFSVTCMKRNSPTTLGVTHWCADYSSYLSFSEKTLNGGFAKTFGAMQSSSNDDPDSVLVMRFKCQKVG
jgi:hypothetical protein